MPVMPSIERLQRQTPTERKIEFLINRKVPLYSQSKAAFRLGDDPEQAAKKRKYINDGNAYKDELLRLPETDLIALYNKELELSKIEEENAHKARIQVAEDARSFNQSQAATNFIYWVKAKYWNLEEATLIILGRDPDKVKEYQLKELKGQSTFVDRYFQLQRLLSRDINSFGMSSMNDSKTIMFYWIYPSKILHYLKTKQIEFPEELEIELNKLYAIPDYKTLYETEKSNALNLQNTAKNQLEEIGKQKHTIATFKELIAEKPEPENKTAIKRRETSMLKLIAGMSMDHYKYHPNKEKQSCVASIQSSLNLMGLSLTDKIIRKYLEEAGKQIDSKNLPPLD